jgi:hypothetical protein
MQRKDVDAHEEAAMKKHNRLLLARDCAVQGEINALKDAIGRRGKEVIELRVKHAELTGAEPFVPHRRDRPTRIYSEERIVEGCTFRMEVDVKDPSEADFDHYGIRLWMYDGPVPCKVQYSFELVHHDGRAASAKTSIAVYTWEAGNKGKGKPKFVPKARLANAATSPYVKNGYVTFKCTIEIV